VRPIRLRARHALLSPIAAAALVAMPAVAAEISLPASPAGNQPAVMAPAADGRLAATAGDTSADAANHPADNTGRNKRDRDDRSVTPMDQSNNKGDLEITRQIRREITRNDSLSTNAHNVKIVTQQGVVTLRGPVKSPEEKATIARLAQQAPGVKRVDDQLEVQQASARSGASTASQQPRRDADQE